MRFTANYMGTELNGSWAKAYRGPGLFVRGLGEGRFEDGQIVFLRKLGREPFHLPLSSIDSVESGTWHRGKYVGRGKVIKLLWQREGHELSSGFAFGRVSDAEAFAAAVRDWIR